MFNLLPVLEAEASSSSLFGGTMGTVIYFGALFAIMYFILIRPNSKRQKAVRELQSSVKIGDWVLTTSGFYGKVVDLVNDLAIVEIGLNKGVTVPIQRSAITSIAEPQLTISKDSPVEVKK